MIDRACSQNGNVASSEENLSKPGGHLDVVRGPIAIVTYVRRDSHLRAVGSEAGRQTGAQRWRWGAGGGRLSPSPRVGRRFESWEPRKFGLLLETQVRGHQHNGRGRLLALQCKRRGDDAIVRDAEV